MASVYRAADVLLARSVAIKMLRPELEGAAVRSARSETAVLASHSHPNLVTLFDAHLAPHSPEYLVMEQKAAEEARKAAEEARKAAEKQAEEAQKQGEGKGKKGG